MWKKYSFLLCIICAFLGLNCSIISKFSYDFMVKWTLNKEDFERAGMSDSTVDNPVCLRKTTFNFTSVGNLTFSLCLLKNPTLLAGNNGSFEFCIALQPVDSDVPDSLFDSIYHLDYAYVATPRGVYSLKSAHYFPIKLNKMTAGDVASHSKELFPSGYTTAYCQIRIKTLVKPSFLDEDNIQLESYVPLPSTNKNNVLCSSLDEYSRYLIREYPRALCPLPRTIIYVDNYCMSGAMSEFNDILANSLLSLPKEYIDRWQVPELQALSVEYKIQHLTCRNLFDNLKLSVEKNIHVLKEKCWEFLLESCKIS